MRLRVNGEWTEWPAPMTVADLLERLGLGGVAVGIAVAVNNEVVPRARWSETVLQDGDVVEIVRAVAGGRGVPA
ncbi:Sulfur carrier protein ThiS [bacterium HR11]|nr:Sulfur carrier protein ThiS [bacterium HR11]